MFEFHGWAVLRWPGESEGAREQMNAIRHAVEAARDDFCSIDLVTAGNSLSVVSMHGLRNHRKESVFHLLNTIAREAKASYGLLYVRDDEDSLRLDCDNSFRVWRLALGEISEVTDPFLSPCVPTIEGPYSGEDT